jgi:hypothetical protein
LPGMTRTERARLLRDRLRAVRGYDLPPYPKGAKVEAPVVKNTTGKGLGVFYGVSVWERRRGWVGRADAKPASAPKPKRTARISPLIRIAEQYPFRPFR